MKLGLMVTRWTSHYGCCLSALTGFASATAHHQPRMIMVESLWGCKLKKATYSLGHPLEEGGYDLNHECQTGNSKNERQR